MNINADAEQPVLDPRTYPVATDGAMSQAQLASLGSHRGGDLITSDPTTKRTRSRSRSGRPVATPAQPVVQYERTDNRSELARLRSVREGQAEEIARLTAEVAYLRDGIGHLLRRVFPHGLPVNESETL